ncbi:MAG: hypothetical protein H6Q59_898 [Firmicutes bacterium]|nr:hypothetical protein [Bacillota bacterium]
MCIYSKVQDETINVSLVMNNKDSGKQVQRAILLEHLLRPESSLFLASYNNCFLMFTIIPVLFVIEQQVLRYLQLRLFRQLPSI